MTTTAENTDVIRLPPSGTVQANGQELYYEVHGDGPPLVLVMGIGYDSSLWTLAQVPALSTQFRVVLVDNRDAGRSSKASQPYEIADMADDLAGLLDALGIPQSHLLGLSMGGMIAQEFALRHADRLDRLGARRDGSSAGTKRRRSDPDLELGQGQRRDRGGVRWATVRVPLLHRLPSEPPGGAGHRRAAGKQPVPDESRGVRATGGCVPPVRCPRSAGRNHGSDPGGRGRAGPADATLDRREVADAIPGARFEVIRGDGSSHLVPIERPDDFNRLVSDFLNEAER